jgi:hypothetical protein
MASTQLTVTVNGGTPPVSIRVNFFKQGVILFTLHFPGSFTHNFSNLDSGNYSIFIGGVNPLPSPAAPNPNTKCEITTTNITLHPPDNSPVIKSGRAYVAEFHFTV